jgi:hypothetical protein
MQRNWKRWAIRISACLAAALIALICAAELMIGLGVRRFSLLAQEHYPGDRVQALAEMVECDSCSLRDRNHAVWALGQLADRTALPVMEKYYTGRQCDHGKELCQYELRKALQLIRKGHNSEAALWRWMLPNRS